MGYDKNSPSYLVLHPDTGKIVKYRLVRFVEVTVEQCTQTDIPDCDDIDPPYMSPSEVALERSVSQNDAILTDSKPIADNPNGVKFNEETPENENELENRDNESQL